MTEEVLSQTEVESLLKAMESAAPPISNPTAGEPAPMASEQSSRPRERIVPYDFKRPERVGKEQMRALQSLHEGFGRNFGAALSAMLRTMVEVKLTSVDQLTYSEFVFSLENPTCFNLLKADPLEGSLILDISPAILYPIIDRLLGGGKTNSPPARRPLTEIELRLVSRISKLFLDELQRAWENVVELELSVERVESNPQLIQVVPPNEVVILISFELTVGDVRGMLNLCIPFNSIERFSAKLAENTWVNYGRNSKLSEFEDQIGHRLSGSLVELTVILADTQITTADLIGLRVGDIITTDKDVHEPLEVAVAGVSKFNATPGVLKGKKAIEVTGAIQPKPTKQESPVSV